MTLRLGTRASLLAVTQSQLVADAITAATGEPVELVRITSHGDVTTGSLAQMGGTGVFATALREALLAGECDLLVHSMKDLPTAPYAGLSIGAVPVRAPAADALCGRGPLTLDSLPQGARVGTGSPRRAAQLRAARPDLEVLDIRGNVDSRLQKVDDGEFDAIVLAQAGLTRIGRTERIGEVMPWPTSAAQGALAIEVRTEDLDGPIGAAIAHVEDATSRVTSHLERAVLRQLEAGCAAPIGLRAERAGDEVTLLAEVYAPTGEQIFRAIRSVPFASVSSDADRERVAQDVVTELLDAGAGAFTRDADA